MVSISAYAVETDSIYYSLPSQNQGHFLTAKKLFANPNGGVWVQDIYNHIHFYDGQHLLPKSSSILDINPEQVTYLEGDFWYFQNNHLYRKAPSGKKRLVFSLPSNSKFKKMGQSNGLLWLYSAHFFHSVDPKTGKTISYPIQRITQGSIDENTVIQGAVFYDSRWLISTKTSLYYLSRNGVKRATPDSFSNISQLVLDKKHRQLLVGTDQHLFRLDLNKHPLQRQTLAKGQVQAVLVTDDGYWIGTRKGLYMYSFETQTLSSIQANYQDDYALSNNTILALASDNKSGIWIATTKGVNYYSTVSTVFNRIRFGDGATTLLPYSHINQLQIVNDGTIWIATNLGLFSAMPKEKNGRNKIKKVVDGNTVNLRVNEGLVWFTQGDRLFKLDAATNQIEEMNQDAKWYGNKITHLAITEHGTIWLSTGKGLYRYFPNQRKGQDFGKSWMVDKYGPSDITELYTGKNGAIWVGTEHGVYEYKNREVIFDANSVGYGTTTSISEFNGETLWTANSYGVRALNLKNRVSIEVPLRNRTSVPLCVAASQYGTWMTTSKGLSFYNDDTRLTKHYSAPLGVVTNEFLPDLCALSPNGEHLALGSKLGVVSASTQRLHAQDIPANTVLIGEVQANRSVIAVAPLSDQSLSIDYGQSLTLSFGILPDFDTPHLQYRLVGGQDESWIAYKGSQLTFDHLDPGKYTLELKTSSQIGSNQKGTQLFFVVNKPWYLLPWVVTLFAVMLLAVIISIIAWRSRIMVRSNFHLRRLINLKTQQLKHQSQLLITTNMQLRKQAQTRQILVKEMAGKAKQAVEGFQLQVQPPSNEFKIKHAEQLSSHALDQLEQILALHSSKAKENTFLDGQVVSLVIHTVVQGWKADIDKAGVYLEVEDLTAGCTVKVKHFNLDSVINTLIASALIRSASNQTIYLCAKLLDNELQINIEDTGNGLTEEEILEFEAHEYGLDAHTPVYNLSDTSLSAIAHMVTQSGGRFDFRTNRICHTTELSVSWPVDACQESKGIQRPVSLIGTNQSIASLENESGIPEECEGSLTLCVNTGEEIAEQDAWLNKVYGLVEKHYPNPDFGTSSAAKLLFVSERSLQRKFKSLTKGSFMDYVIKVRLEHACERLMSGQKIADIAFETGFNDPSYFSQRFKHHFGLSPSKFIENASNE